MKHPIVAKVAEMVFSGDINNAENALVQVAEDEGDHALAIIIQAMPPRDIVAILREHDSSKISVIGELITPRDFLAAVALERNYKDKTHAALKGMINAVLFRDENDTDEFIEILGASEDGLNALVNYFSERHEEIEHFFRNGTFSNLDGDDFSDIPSTNDDLAAGDPNEGLPRNIIDFGEVQDHDWQELAWRLRCGHYDIFRDILQILRSRLYGQTAPSTPAKAQTTGSSAENPDEEDIL